MTSLARHYAFAHLEAQGGSPIGTPDTSPAAGEPYLDEQDPPVPAGLSVAPRPSPFALLERAESHRTFLALLRENGWLT